MVHGYGIDIWISFVVFSMNGCFGMDIAWTLQPGSFIKCPITGIFISRLGSKHADMFKLLHLIFYSKNRPL